MHFLIDSRSERVQTFHFLQSWPFRCFARLVTDAVTTLARDDVLIEFLLKFVTSALACLKLKLKLKTNLRSLHPDHRRKHLARIIALHNGLQAPVTRNLPAHSSESQLIWYASIERL